MYRVVFGCTGWLFSVMCINLKMHGICLSPISSAVYRPIGAKLGRKVGDGCGSVTGAMVSMATNLLPWQPKKKIIFKAQPGLKLVRNIARASRMGPGGTLG